jgi:hypothetical protein
LACALGQGRDVKAQELDSARQAYFAIRDILGYTDFEAIDTGGTNEVVSQLNAGLRALETDIPFTVADTITVANKTFQYTLHSRLLRPPTGEMSDYKVVRISKNGRQIYGLNEIPLSQFGMVPFVTSAVVSFAVQGDVLLLASDSPPGDLLYVYGDGTITPVSHGGSVLTGIPETVDRWAAVYYAASVLARARERLDIADQNAAEYAKIVLSRTGRLPTVGVPQQ